MDDELRKGIVSPESFKQLMDAEIYGAATTLGWLETRLKILTDVINSGYSVYYNTGRNNGQIKNMAMFNDWCNKYFPDVYTCFFK